MRELEETSVEPDFESLERGLNAECHECGRKFDFSVYFDKEEITSFFEVILREAGGGKELCPDCKKIKPTSFGFV